MPLLAGWLTTLFSGLAAWFGQWLTKRAALIAAGLSTFTALLVALYGAMAAAVASLVVAFPAGMVGTGVWLFVPDNAPFCMAVALSADTALALFFWQNVHLQMAMRGAS